MYLEILIDVFIHFEIGLPERPDLRFVLNNFCHVLSRFYLLERIAQRAKLVLRKLFLRMNLWVFN